MNINRNKKQDRNKKCNVPMQRVNILLINACNLMCERERQRERDKERETEREYESIAFFTHKSCFTSFFYLIRFNNRRELNETR